MQASKKSVRDAKEPPTTDGIVWYIMDKRQREGQSVFCYIHRSDSLDIMNMYE